VAGHEKLCGKKKSKKYSGITRIYYRITKWNFGSYEVEFDELYLNTSQKSLYII